MKLDFENTWPVFEYDRYTVFCIAIPQINKFGQLFVGAFYEEYCSLFGI